MKNPKDLEPYEDIPIALRMDRLTDQFFDFVETYWIRAVFLTIAYGITVAISPYIESSGLMHSKIYAPVHFLYFAAPL